MRTGTKKRTLPQRIALEFSRNHRLWVLLLPLLVYYLLFHYLPLYGIQIAFREYKGIYGIAGSPWVGLEHFSKFLTSYYSLRLIYNTFILNFIGIICSFPIPIVLAILINQLSSDRFKRFSQTLIYIPHFISTVVMVGILYLFLSPSNGIINKVITLFGKEPIFFMIEPNWFRPVFIISDIWQHSGWSAILYIATLTGIDPCLYEAASIDGAKKLQKIIHIDIPHLIPIAVMMLILSCGSMLGSNTDKTLLLQTSGNLATSDIIGVYVYSQGLGKAQFSYTSAIGLFVNIINFITIISVNWVAKKVGETSLF
ncbi:MAG: sugar ABC transporter permease [Clostridia bacterium]|nr:sugar ABC transporter permease [Clostridia bacterium]